MERLTERLGNGVINVKYASQHETAIHRLVTIEDILGDEYDLERLRVIMDAEQHGGLIVGYGPGDPGEPGELGVMEEVAADNVVVVRCRECKRWDDNPDSYGKDDGPKGKCMKSFEETYDNDFCSYGERREADHDKHPSDPV